MRFVIRVATWALAAVGIKALDDRYAPKATELRKPASEVFDTAKNSAREVVEHAQAAGSEIVRQRSVAVRGVAADAIDDVTATATTDPGSRTKTAKR